MEMEDQYNMSDLRQLMNGGGRTHFPSIPLQAATELFPTHRPPPLTSPQAHHQQAHHHPYEQLMMMSRHQAHEIIPRGLHHHHEFRSPDSSSGGAACNNSITAAPCLSGGGGLEGEAGGCVGGEGSGRWPRQETLTLLEIRSRLDFKFKEANQKGPLWDEVSRIMGEEHGYQRSGKKCREKFENLYKYYKKTKEGKAGRQDGKHYRFFRQLEALYGETTNTAPSLPDQTHFIGNNNNSLHYQTANNSQLPNQDTTPYHNQSHNKHCDSLSLSNNSSEFDTSSSEDQDINDVSPTGAMDDDSLEITKTAMRKRRGGGRGSWKAKIKDFIDAQMRKLMDKQEEWLERLMRTLEQKEKERMVREEDWRKQEVERVEREHKFWAKERAWIEARDKALMEALHKLTDHQEKGNNNNNNNISSSSPDDHDDDDHHQNSTAKDQLLLNKKRKENVNSRSSACYFQNNDQSCSSLYSCGQGAAYCGEMSEQQQGGNDQHGSSTSPCGQDANVGNAVQVVHDNCFPFLMSEGENLWENYGLKLSKGSQNQ